MYMIYPVQNCVHLLFSCTSLNDVWRAVYTCAKRMYTCELHVVYSLQIKNMDLKMYVNTNQAF